MASAVLTSIGIGLISTWQVDTSMAIWIGYQVLFGFGLGLGTMQPNLAAQTVLDPKDVQTGIALVFLHQFLGGAIFVSVGQNVLSSSLISGLKMALNGSISPSTIVHTGATELRNIVPEAKLPITTLRSGMSSSSAFAWPVSRSLGLQHWSGGL
jgi:hypothetical protein